MSGGSRRIRSIDSARPPHHRLERRLDRLFVYGSLREGQKARSLVADRIARWETASLPVRSTRCARLPRLYRRHAGRVIGELVWLTDLPATLEVLDDYEGRDFARVVRRSSAPPARRMELDLRARGSDEIRTERGSITRLGAPCLAPLR